MSQLSKLSTEHLTSHGKQSIVPGLLVFSDFIVKSSKSYGPLQTKLDYYGMAMGDPRPNFDPEGYIRIARSSQKLKAGEHKSYLLDDLIKNIGREEAGVKRIKFEKVMQAYKWKLFRRKMDENVLQKIEDPLELANKLVEHELEILEGVPPHVFRDYIDTIRNTPLVMKRIHR